MTTSPAAADRLAAVFLPDLALPAQGRLALYALDGGTLRGAAAAVDLPDGEPGTATLVLPSLDGPPAAVSMALLAWPLAVVLPGLLAPSPGRMWPDSLRAWRAAAQLGLRLVAAGRLVPSLLATQGGVIATWHADGSGDDVDEHLAGLVSAFPVAGHCLARPGHDGTIWRPEALVGAFLDAVADTAVRTGGVAPRPGRPRARLLPWTARWAEGLADPTDPSVPLRDDAEELVAGIAAWAGGSRHAAAAGRLELTLDAPSHADQPWRVSFAVLTDDGARASAADVWTERGDPAAPTELEQGLLAGLAVAARVVPALDRALQEATPQDLLLDLHEAWGFLQSVEVLYAEGIAVVVPSEITAGELALRLRVGLDEPATEHDLDLMAPDLRDGLAEPPQLGIDDGASGSGAFTGLLTGFRWEVALAGQPLTADEFAELVAAKAPLVRFRDRWVRVDPGRVDRLQRLGPPGRLTLADALAVALAGAAPPDLFAQAQAEDVEVVIEGSLQALVERIREAGERPPAPATPDGFVGVLRPYQGRGVAWLQGMAELGLGAVLADEMGLGKTVQLAAHLLDADQERPHLVVCPTSVLGNWQRELGRFAPRIPVTRHHGADRSRDLRGTRGVVLTTYGTLRRDVDVLADVDWEVVTLDEAQQVKNATTAGARAIRRLRARQKVALTGTPLENRLQELWALLDATNPGLLGTRASFQRRFAAPIEQHSDPGAGRRLRKLVAPFILRREKSDPEVITDLPDKLERTVPCSLTPEQAALYQAAVERAMGTLAASQGIQRRGRILALLTELKQICNHPAQFLREREGDAPPVLPGRSGKLAVARELVAEAVASGAQLLCYTQYVEMGHLLVSQLSQDLGVGVPFLHGGVPARRRDLMVAAFQGEADAVEALGSPAAPPVLVVSLRAGGTGLNLTAASHVLHYDRWWNPAVEDQATDRAHRIGQTRNVTVHKLVTAGTVEERVAEVLERKRELAQTIVGAGEAWITELGEAELGELVALSADAPVTAADADDDEWQEAS